MEEVKQEAAASTGWRAISFTMVCLAVTGMAAAMTHAYIPLSRLGTSSLYGDIVIFGYILAWGAQAIFHHPLSYYDPPIFYPGHQMLPGTDGLELQSLLL